MVALWVMGWVFYRFEHSLATILREKNPCYIAGQLSLGLKPVWFADCAGWRALPLCRSKVQPVGGTHLLRVCACVWVCDCVFLNRLPRVKLELKVWKRKEEVSHFRMVKKLHPGKDGSITDRLTLSWILHRLWQELCGQNIAAGWIRHVGHAYW